MSDVYCFKVRIGVVLIRDDKSCWPARITGPSGSIRAGRWKWASSRLPVPVSQGITRMC